MNPSPPNLRDTILVPEALRGLPIINRVMQHAPLYSLQAWAGAFDARPLGLTRVERSHVNDDRVGRALERRFHADRDSLLTRLSCGSSP
jgi:hypothetical protein